MLRAGYRAEGLDQLRVALTLRPDWKTLLDTMSENAEALEVELPPQPLIRPPGLVREERGTTPPPRPLVPPSGPHPCLDGASGEGP